MAEVVLTTLVQLAMSNKVDRLIGGLGGELGGWYGGGIPYVYLPLNTETNFPKQYCHVARPTA